MVKKQQILKKNTQRTIYPKQFIRVCAVPILLSLVYHLQKNMIIIPIELCNPLVADPEYQKNTNLGFYKLHKAPFQALDFDFFLGEHEPRPL